ncbi:hypothetical protein O6H91_05G118600 [Diphasiastrum complanatum]|uniref:Uncharacterized protein n=1 Tax=Diphasiastrum complanatum TaxID=34168 RepID=A0ACC2DSN4_DIPCM|nr:hypothetical protein O6H91_05G118600 [Diphasiastrum complanatum]
MHISQNEIEFKWTDQLSRSACLNLETSSAASVSVDTSMEKPISLQVLPAYVPRHSLCSKDDSMLIRSKQQTSTLSTFNSFRGLSRVLDNVVQPNSSSKAAVQYRPKASSLRQLICNDSAFPLSHHRSKQAEQLCNRTTRQEETNISQKKKRNRIRSLSYVHISPDGSHDCNSSPRRQWLTTGSAMTQIEAEPLGLTDHRRFASQSKTSAQRLAHRECCKCNRKMSAEIVQAMSALAGDGEPRSLRLCNSCDSQLPSTSSSAPPPHTSSHAVRRQSLCSSLRKLGKTFNFLHKWKVCGWRGSSTLQ